jgi:hypothetical protein
MWIVQTVSYDRQQVYRNGTIWHKTVGYLRGKTLAVGNIEDLIIHLDWIGIVGLRLVLLR